MVRRRWVSRLLGCAWSLLVFALAAFGQSPPLSRLPIAGSDGDLVLASSSSFAVSSPPDSGADSKSSSSSDSDSILDANAISSAPAPVRTFPGVPAPLPAVGDHFQISQRCADGTLSGKDCKFHWWPALGEQMEDLTIETSWNLVQNYWVRYNTFHGNFWHNYWLSVEGFRFSRWSDNNPVYDDYVGHPMMGAISMDIVIQNDPRGMSLELENSRAYWHSRLRALLWSTIYSAEWKVGPVSEASFGAQGRDTYWDKSSNRWTNGTGTVGLVVTPLGGWVWGMGEDLIDQHIIRRIETKSSNPLYLTAIQILNPCRGFSNLMRFKAPWYRDSRDVVRFRIDANNSGD